MKISHGVGERPITADQTAFRRFDEPRVCCHPDWEAAYLRFESDEQEVDKFLRRLKWADANGWNKESQIVELFCGRGNGLAALTRLGFRRLEGCDLSESLLRQYRGSATCYLCDCRRLHFENASRDILIAQGGLHHLDSLPGDLVQTLREAARVLRPDGLLLVVEPWRTPFLAAVEFVSRRPLARRLWAKLDAFATMGFHERQTYERWLSSGAAIREVFARHFICVKSQIRFGKILYLGRNRGP